MTDEELERQLRATLTRFNPSQMVDPATAARRAIYRSTPIPTLPIAILVLAIGATFVWTSALDGPSAAGPSGSPASTSMGSRGAVTMSPSLAGASLAALKGRFLAVGGSGDGAPSSAARTMDVTTGEWHRLPDLRVPRINSAVAQTPEGSVYVLGGTGAGGRWLVSVEYLAADGDDWRTAPELPQPLAFTAAAVAPTEAVYVFGGITPARPTRDTALVLRQGDDAWTNLPPLPTGRSHAGIVVVGGTIFVVGGNEGDERPFSSAVEAFDIASETWTTRASLPAGLNSVSLIAIDESSFLALGGYGLPSGTSLTSVYRYDVPSDVWTEMGDLGTPVAGASTTTAADGSIVVLSSDEGRPHVIRYDGH